MLDLEIEVGMVCNFKKAQTIPNQTIFFMKWFVFVWTKGF